MKTKNQFIKKWLIYVFMLINIALVLDFLIPGQEINSKILFKEKKEQRYFNAGQNSHYSFALHTAKHIIDIDEVSFDAVAVGDSILFTSSMLFQETNSYGLADKARQTNSLRSFSGLYLPLLALVTLCLGLYLRKRVDILVFVVQIMTLLNLVYCLN